jgi:hypothetical protein
MSLNTLGIRTEAFINIVERVTGNTEVILKLALTGLARLCRGPGIKSRLFRSS